MFTCAKILITDIDEEILGICEIASIELLKFQKRAARLALDASMSSCQLLLLICSAETGMDSHLLN
jgi:hypothetical protein